MSTPSTPSSHLGEAWSPEANGPEQGGSSGGSSPAVGYAHANGRSKTVTWSAAGANGGVSYPAKQPGFIGRHYRKLSGSLPRFRSWGNGRDFAQKEKLGRGRWLSANGNMRRNLTSIGARILRRMRLRFVVILAFLLAVFLFYVTREWDRGQEGQAEVGLTVGAALHRLYRGTGYLGGGSRYVILLGANHGGGVMEWKGAREWAIERDSIRNKREYAQKWGYHLEIVDMSTKKRYAHEWRESWEKVDGLRNAMRNYPHAEW